MVDRRRFLKYVGTGLVTAAAAGAGCLFYGKQRGAAPTGTLTTSLAHTTATMTATPTRAYEGLTLVFPESNVGGPSNLPQAELEPLYFLDENCNTISSHTPWASSWSGNEYRVGSIPESARFLKLSACAIPGYSYWDDVSFNEIKRKAKRMDVRLAQRSVDSAQIYARQEIYYLKLGPEMDSDRDGISDKDDANPRIPEPKPVQPRNGMTVMAVYLPSWGCEVAPWLVGTSMTFPKSRTLTIGTELHPILGQRYPIDNAGTYNCKDPEIVDWHIKWALEHGINAFMIDWMPFEVNTTGEWSHTVEDGFLRASYRDMMQFAIMHITDPTWDYPEFFKGYEYVNAAARRGLDYVRENYLSCPSYLRVGKKYFYMLFRIRKYAITHGLDKFLDLVQRIHDQDIYLVGDIGTDPYPRDRKVDEDIVSAFDAITAYNWNWAGASDKWEKAKREGSDVWLLVAPYSSLVSGYREEWAYWSELARDRGVGFITPLCAGFSNRAPYESKEAYKEDWLVERTGRTPDLFRKMCQQSIPIIERSGTNMCLIDGWNEIHECSTLEPMVEHGFDYLNVVRDVFCDEPGGGWPANVVPTREGVRQYLA